MSKIGKFKQVELRSIWEHEALDFTKWLALNDNMELLSEVLGISILEARTEVGVGKFAVDILAVDDNGHNVIIENQLESTNHDHLGKIITYAAGLQAETIIWIVKKAREEHEKAVNWLNDNTAENVNVFLIEIEAWKIDDSAPAPRFNIIAKPNEWAKTVKQTQTSSSTVSDYKLKQQEFFASVREYGEQHARYVPSWQKPQPQHWYNVRLGSSKAQLVVVVNSVRGYVCVKLEVHDDKELFVKLESKKEEIEAKLGFSLEWTLKEDKKISMADIKIDGDIENDAGYESLVQWVVDKLDIMSKVLPSYIRKSDKR